MTETMTPTEIRALWKASGVTQEEFILKVSRARRHKRPLARHTLVRWMTGELKPNGVNMAALLRIRKEKKG